MSESAPITTPPDGKHDQEITLSPDQLGDPQAELAQADEQGLGGDNGTPTQQRTDIKSTYVMDEDRAWAMAEAVHEGKSESAEERKMADIIKGSGEEYFTRDTKIAIRQHVEDGLPPQKKDETDAIVNTIQQHPAVRNAWEYGNIGTEVVSDKLKKKAEDQDKHLDKVEEWAGILHDHPISDAYQEAHSFSIEITPEYLAQQEKEHELDLEAIRHKEEALARQTPADAVSGYLSRTEKLSFSDIMHQYVDRDEAQRKIEEWHDMLENPDTTLGQIKKTYDENFIKYYIGSMEDVASYNAGVMDDIKSGRASDPAYTKPN